MGGLIDDVVDLQVVVAHLTKELGYEIDMLVGHSRGSLVSFHWLSTAPEAKTVTKFVNVSGRYRMEVRSSLPYSAIIAHHSQAEDSR